MGEPNVKQETEESVAIRYYAGQPIDLYKRCDPTIGKLLSCLRLSKRQTAGKKLLDPQDSKGFENYTDSMMDIDGIYLNAVYGQYGDDSKQIHEACNRVKQLTTELTTTPADFVKEETQEQLNQARAHLETLIEPWKSND